VIKLTRLTGAAFVLNSDLILTMEATPDTVLTLTTEQKLLVRENLDEVIARIIEYKRKIFLNSIPDLSDA
jgi:flagellar protein FlbD